MTPKNVVHVFQDAIEFENAKLQTECEKMIITHFHEVLSVSEEFVLSLPKVNLVNLLKYDSLQVDSEYELVELISKYFEKRKDIKDEPKNVISAEIWNALSVNEQNARTKQWNDEKSNRVKIDLETHKNDAVNYQKMAQW